jgi:hypothetical protein
MKKNPKYHVNQNLNKNKFSKESMVFSKQEEQLQLWEQVVQEKLPCSIF